MKKYINQADMKQVNISDTLALIRRHGSLTRKQICELTDFSWGGVSKFASLLLEKNLVIEQQVKKNEKKGRTAHTLHINNEDNFILGIDVNISGIRGTVINLMNEVLCTHEIIADYSGKDSLLRCIFSMIRVLLSRFSTYNILGIGIAMQGSVDNVNGVSVRLNQCPDWKNINLAEEIKKQFGLDTYLEHDPNCILLAHTETNNLSDALLFRVDKGVGMAVKKAGRLICGEGMLEIGHTTVVYDNATRCFCGNFGCLESYASQNGIITLAGEPFEDVVEKARNGSKQEQLYFSNMAKYLGTSIANMMRIFCIDRLILCGSMMDYRDLFFGQMMQIIANHSIIDGKSFVPQVTILDKEDAAYGAAIMASDQIIESIIVDN